MAPRIPSIPSDFAKQAKEMKVKYFDWSLLYSSHTKINSLGSIQCFSVPASRGNFILIPGLASNTSIEPLMKAITYWALSHNINIYTLDHFFGEFKPDISQEDADRNTYDEFKATIDVGLDAIQNHIRESGWKRTLVMTHSLSSSASIDIFNQRINDGKKLRFDGAIMFAPHITGGDENSDYKLEEILRNRNDAMDMPDKKWNEFPVGIASPHNNPIAQYVTIKPQLFKDLRNREFRPDLMTRWNIPVTFAVGGRDRKAPPAKQREVFNLLSKEYGAENFRFVEFPNSKHSFLNSYTDFNSILALIKSMRVRSVRGL